MDEQVQISQRIRELRTRIEWLFEKLNALEFQFYHPEGVLPGVESDVEQSIAHIESHIGNVPFAVAEFWRTIGPVDITGTHPDWYGCDYPDGLFILPSTKAAEEVDEFLADYEQRVEYDFPYLIPISPDRYHKEDVSGGMWYNVDCPSALDDPIVNDEGRELTFLDYVEFSLSWGGFAGLEDSPHHGWPVTDLVPPNMS